MNKLDIQFNNLVTSIKTLSYETVSKNIVDTYLKIDDYNKNAIEKFLRLFNYWGNLDYQNNNFEELERRAEVLKKHSDDFLWLYDSLEDYRSKQVLYGILNYWYNNDFTVLGKCREENFLQYFDLDLIKVDPNEVFVDIYAYEITEASVKTMQSNLQNYPNIDIRKKAVADVKSEFFIKGNTASASANVITNKGTDKINSVTLDEDITEEITLIKMDIEGSEESALLGASKHIKNDTPKLLISVYHNHNDLWKLPKLIYSINNNYQFYLRYFGNRYYPTEVVLVAIPK